MGRWEIVDTACTPGEERELRLYRRGDEFAIRVRGYGDLMNSRTHGSEDALGRMTCHRLARPERARLLIGGLGMGFTLASTLAELGPDASIEVAELVPEVVRWNQGDLGACAGFPLRDPRVQLRVADVAVLLREASEAYDAILLDVDNGPEALTRSGNDDLYALSGLAEAYFALKPRGLLAVWSAGPDRRFQARLGKVGFAVEECRVRAHRGKGSRHIIWFARRDA